MTDKKPSPEESKNEKKQDKATSSSPKPNVEDMPEEFGGVDGPEPTRYGDWEKNGRCTDF